MKIFDTKNELNQSLAQEITSIIKQAIEKTGKAHLLLSGGSSPVALYEMLAQIELPWEHVLIGLVDERFVSLESEFSNERMIRSTMIQHFAAKATLLGMVEDVVDYEVNRQRIDHVYLPFKQQLDLVLLGMGEDGHTASLFPGDRVSEELLNSNQKGVFNTNSPNEPTRRITCSKEMLFGASNTLLMLSGKAKKEVFENASTTQLPISYWGEEKLKVYYSIH